MHLSFMRLLVFLAGSPSPFHTCLNRMYVEFKIALQIGQ